MTESSPFRKTTTTAAAATSSSSLREPLLDPETVANSSFWVTCGPSSPDNYNNDNNYENNSTHYLGPQLLSQRREERGRTYSDTSIGLEGAMRSSYERGITGMSIQGEIEDDDANSRNNDNNQEENVDTPDGLFRSERCSTGSRLPWYRHPLQMMAMLSNFSTSFNVVNISLVLPILRAVLGDVYYYNSMNNNGNDEYTVRAEDESIVASSLLAGMIGGQLLGGALGDSFLGYSGALALVMMLQFVASLGSAMVPLHHGGSSATATDFYWNLAAWRFVLGIGAGAVYPLAACLSAEQGAATTSSCKDHEALRMKRVVWTFAMQGVGFWIVPALACALVYCRMPLTHVWRVLLGTGCIPGVVLLYMQYHLFVYQPPVDGAVVVATEETVVPESPRPVAQLDEDRPPHMDSELKGNSMDGDISTNNQTKGRGANMDEQEDQAEKGMVETTDLGTTADVEEGPLNGTEDNSNQIQAASLERQAPHNQQNGTHEPPETTDMADRELHDDSDGEVGTFLDSSPDLDMSSAGVFRESEPPAINTGWWISIQTEEGLVRKLMGTAVTWFLFDVLFYGNTLFQPVVIEHAFGSRKDMANEALIRRVAIDSLVLNSISLPGYFVAALLIGRTTCGIKQSPRYVMIQGFAGMAIVYLAIGIWWQQLKQYPILLVFLYGLTFFFANYGPNTTTFILPSLVYSAECRSTFNGISAACGKLGALVGASLFGPLNRMFHEQIVMLLCSWVALMALAMTITFVKLRRVPVQNAAPGRGRFSVLNPELS